MLLFDYLYSELSGHPRLIPPSCRRRLLAMLNTGCHLHLTGNQQIIRLVLMNAFSRLNQDSRVYYPRKYNVHITVNSSKTLNIGVLIHKQNYELTPSKYDMYDKIVLDKIIHHFCSHKSIHDYYQSRRNTLKTIILYDVEQLTPEGQYILKRFMDTKKNVRFILCSHHSVSSILQSRTIHLPIPSPSLDIQLSIIKDLLLQYIQSTRTKRTTNHIEQIFQSLEQDYRIKKTYTTFRDLFQSIELILMTKYPSSKQFQRVDSVS